MILRAPAEASPTAPSDVHGHARLGCRQTSATAMDARELKVRPRDEAAAPEAGDLHRGTAPTTCRRSRRATGAHSRPVSRRPRRWPRSPPRLVRRHTGRPARRAGQRGASRWPSAAQSAPPPRPMMQGSATTRAGNSTVCDIVALDYCRKPLAVPPLSTWADRPVKPEVAGSSPVTPAIYLARKRPPVAGLRLIALAATFASPDVGTYPSQHRCWDEPEWTPANAPWDAFHEASHESTGAPGRRSWSVAPPQSADLLQGYQRGYSMILRVARHASPRRTQTRFRANGFVNDRSVRSSYSPGRATRANDPSSPA